MQYCSCATASRAVAGAPLFSSWRRNRFYSRCDLGRATSPCLKLTFLQTRRRNLFVSGELRRSAWGLVLVKGFFFTPNFFLHAASPWGEGAGAAPAMGWPQWCAKPSVRPLSTGEGGSVKSAVAQGAFASPPVCSELLAELNRGCSLMREAAGSSYKKKKEMRKPACVAWQNKS